MNAINIVPTWYGYGRHVATLSPKEVIFNLKIVFASQFLYDVGVTLPKISVLLFYARVFSKADINFRYALWAGYVYSVAWCITTLVLALTTCDPITKSWATELPGHCISTNIIWLVSAVTSVILDVYILLLPLPILWRLHLKLSRKIQITVIFICGYW